MSLQVEQEELCHRNEVPVKIGKIWTLFSSRFGQFPLSVEMSVPRDLFKEAKFDQCSFKILF